MGLDGADARVEGEVGVCREEVGLRVAGEDSASAAAEFAHGARAEEAFGGLRASAESLHELREGFVGEVLLPLVVARGLDFVQHDDVDGEVLFELRLVGVGARRRQRRRARRRPGRVDRRERVGEVWVQGFGVWGLEVHAGCDGLAHDCALVERRPLVERRALVERRVLRDRDELLGREVVLDFVQVSLVVARVEVFGLRVDWLSLRDAVGRLGSAGRLGGWRALAARVGRSLPLRLLAGGFLCVFLARPFALRQGLLRAGRGWLLPGLGLACLAHLDDQRAAQKKLPRLSLHDLVEDFHDLPAPVSPEARVQLERNVESLVELPGQTGEHLGQALCELRTVHIAEDEERLAVHRVLHEVVW